MVKIIPQCGDIVQLQFHPQLGKEQTGRRPALVISPGYYNAKIGLAIFCPITKQKKGYTLEVELPPELKTKGVILSDHIKSLDFNLREATFIERAPPSTVKAVLSKLELLLW